MKCSVLILTERVRGVLVVEPVGYCDVQETNCNKAAESVIDICRKGLHKVPPFFIATGNQVNYYQDRNWHIDNVDIPMSEPICFIFAAKRAMDFYCNLRGNVCFSKYDVVMNMAEELKQELITIDEIVMLEVLLAQPTDDVEVSAEIEKEMSEFLAPWN